MTSRDSHGLRMTRFRLLAFVLAVAVTGCGGKAPLPSGTAPQLSRKQERIEREAAERAIQLAAFDQAWQRINDTYPYADFRGLDWPAVKAELRPRAGQARTAAALRPVLGIVRPR